MTYHTPMSYDAHDLRDLGLSSSYEAAEFERVLDIRFSDFTPVQREIWRRQTRCLDRYTRARTYSSAARAAGVTVYTMETWEQDNVLGFSHRKETADREFCDRLEELILDHARKPDSPPSLLTAVLRAHMPEKYGSSRHHVDRETDREVLADEPDAYRKLIADVMQALQEREDSPKPDEQSPASPNDESLLRSPSVRPEPVEGPKPDEIGIDVSASETPDLSHSDHASTAPSLESLPGPFPTTEDSLSEHAPAPSTQHPASNTQNPSPILNRRQRRQLQRQAKRQKSHRARAPN